MKFLLFSMLVAICLPTLSQNLQLHYDFRHSLDPDLHRRNFPTFSFEYFKQLDTVGTGSFLLKIQADLNGRNHNVGQVFTQLSQSLRFWKPKVYLALHYSGGLGTTDDGHGFYLPSSYGAGISYPFQWKGAWLVINALVRHNAFVQPSYDPQVTFYFGRGFFHYKVFVAGSFVCWTENRDRGEVYTALLRGKKLALFGDPQIWIKVWRSFSVGTRLNIFYHVLRDDNSIQIYPTLGTKVQF
ncbi:DUF5020 family protein [Parachryseolinea silvisoli]|uniref:DUF5020 family protein n=1 Tax=Parachryseolinea silvisoli TaxID=2873601 RepID=UPI0022658EB2|nr:DUF5020 family protein [Parachryseolinea silvisoli]MCD9014715.1 DUF5020 family protein [Parachryseolinea silvisoli]